MTRAQLRRFKGVLEEVQAATTLRLAQSRQQISMEHSADALEETCLNLDRDLGFANLSLDSDMLGQIRAALLRVEDGTFGICVSCGDEILLKRLTAVPWSPLCIQCQRVADRHDACRAELFREVHANAA